MESFKPSPPSSSIDLDQSDLGSLLLLKRTSSNSKTHSVEFDFVGSCPKEASSNWSVSDFLPIFNTDKKFYTPSFILKMDNVLLERFSGKIRDSGQDLFFTSSRQGSV
jgi:hypothetical protein